MLVMRAMLCRGAAAARQLCKVLDDMYARNARLADRFHLCGPQHRSTGSHGIVELVQTAGIQVWSYQLHGFVLCGPWHMSLRRHIMRHVFSLLAKTQLRYLPY
jgi:hypothetical protein